MFKESFKYYKAKWPVPDFSEVIDFDASTITTEAREISLSDVCTSSTLPPGLIPVYKWKCFKLDQHPGLVVVRNPFTTQGQRYWMARCLRDYPKRPNIVNLNARIFSQLVIDNWWQELQQCSDKDEARRMKIAMRWTTLGYHHDWDTKVYSEQKRSQFPADLGKLTCYFAELLGFDRFKAEAAIVNYYPIGTTLAGHTDHSEVNLEPPLFSLSFGQTGIFLIGGKTRDDRPSAIFLKSGDILVMSTASRLCYHAVPRILKAKVEPWNEQLCHHQEKTINEQPCKKIRCELEPAPSEWALDMALYQQVADELFWTPFKTYLNDSRININVRQVLPAGQATL